MEGAKPKGERAPSPCSKSQRNNYHNLIVTQAGIETKIYYAQY